MMCRLVVFLLLGARVFALEEVPAPVAALLERAREASPTAMLVAVQAYNGPDHGLVHLVQGQALLNLQRPTEAEAAFRRALTLAPDLKAAHLGLARCAADRGDWSTAAQAGAAGLDLATAGPEGFAFLAQAGLRGGDRRLAAHAIQQGILRFPGDATLRQVEIALLAEEDRPEALRQALRDQLAKTPDNALLWSHLADAARRLPGRQEEALAALELAHLATPGDRSRRLALARAQATAGQVRPALVHWRVLLAAPSSADEVEAAARTAEQAGDLAQARAWLAAVPVAERPRRHVLLAARLALAAGDAPAARTSLDTLLEGGDHDPALQVWAGHLAEQAQDLPRAEACYRLAVSGGHASAGLRLASLFLRQGRRAEAATLLALHVAAHPDDEQARSLIKALER